MEEWLDVTLRILGIFFTALAIVAAVWYAGRLNWKHWKREKEVELVEGVLYPLRDDIENLCKMIVELRAWHYWTGDDHGQTDPFARFGRIRRSFCFSAMTNSSLRDSVVGFYRSIRATDDGYITKLTLANRRFRKIVDEVTGKLFEGKELVEQMRYCMSNQLTDKVLKGEEIPSVLAEVKGIRKFGPSMNLPSDNEMMRAIELTLKECTGDTTLKSFVMKRKQLLTAAESLVREIDAYAQNTKRGLVGRIGIG